MSRTMEEDEVPINFDKEGNHVNIEEGSKSGASNAPTLEDLMKNLEKLKAKSKKIRAKEKKTKVYSSSSEDNDSEEEVSKKGRKESPISLLITLCPSITIPCHLPPLILSYPLEKLHILVGQTIIN
jgi:hypothetical protein